MSYWLSIQGLVGYESNRLTLIKVSQERTNSENSGLIEGAVVRFILHDEEFSAGYIFRNVLGVLEADSGVERAMDHERRDFHIKYRRCIQVR